MKRGIEQAFKSVDNNLKENFVKRVLDYNDEGDVLGKNYVFYEYKAEHQNEDGTVNYADFFKELDKKDYDVDGQAIYDGFSSVGANFVNGFNDENASKLLNKYGIKALLMKVERMVAVSLSLMIKRSKLLINIIKTSKPTS